MKEPNDKKSREELEEELSLWEAFVKTPYWDLLNTELKKRHYLSGVALRRPSADITGVLATEGFKACLLYTSPSPRDA